MAPPGRDRKSVNELEKVTFSFSYAIYNIGVILENIDFVKLGDGCKELEKRGTSVKFTPPGVLMARLDGRSFHSFTKKLQKPVDTYFLGAMISTAEYLVKEFAASFGYTQSDEITLGWDFTSPKPNTEFPFGGKANKLNSILAASTSVEFNSKQIPYKPHQKALFDCRVWAVPDQESAMYNVLWRQLDCERNAINMVASSIFSEKELNGVSTEDRLEMIRNTFKGVELSWPNFRYGTLCVAQRSEKPISENTRLKIPPKHRPKKGVMVYRVLYDYTSTRLASLSKEEAIEKLFKNRIR